MIGYHHKALFSISCLKRFFIDRASLIKCVSHLGSCINRYLTVTRRPHGRINHLETDYRPKDRWPSKGRENFQSYIIYLYLPTVDFKSVREEIINEFWYRCRSKLSGSPICLFTLEQLLHSISERNHNLTIKTESKSQM